uniref:Ribosomal protein 3/homing endonuclease-like fusion protein n=1 Tax=Leptographium europhioides TaxID=67631 RepID=C7SWE0_9PEZI|nr:ribosomal protein 3/homing endonuclease-like fusion protein [Leptographium europhioides]ACV41154.1 ribosomal protein 3/homing endonuclease-like fusion protein [Leptographium europhioides]
MQKDTKFLNKSNIFIKNINNKYKLIPFNIKINFVGENKYFPSDFKEWTNNIYYFNSNYIKNFPVYDLNLNKLLKGYFDLYFNRESIQSKFKFFRKRRLSLNKIFVSKPEIKHTSSKTTITVYVYNRERIVLLKKLIKLRKSLFKINNFFYKCKSISGDLYGKYFINVLYKELVYIRRCKLKLNLNELKFKDQFLHKLSLLISKLYNKKVEFNIINLKSIVYNSSIFTEIMGKKLRNKNTSLLKTMKFILSKGIILEENNKKERSRLIKSVNFSLLENKYKNLNINSFVKDIDLNETIKDLYNLESKDNKDIVFDSIKYKNIGGIRLEAKGRLTKRYRADRALFKVNWKGGLKNTDSSYKGLSSVNFRGNLKSNVEYSMGISKRRIGAFAVKGWISGKSYSTLANFPVQARNDNISPWTITGFADAESSFMLTVSKDSKRNTGWSVRPRFRIGSLRPQ